MPIRVRSVLALPVLGLLSTVTALAAGQDSLRTSAAVSRVRVLGTVGDFHTGDRVVGAFIKIGGNVGGVTDDSGRFRVQLAPGSHLVDIRRLGYEPRIFALSLEPDVEMAELRVALTQVPVELPEVVVTRDRTRLIFGDQRGFYRRQRLGLGHFITRADIEPRQPQVLSDILRPLAGVEVYQAGIKDARVRMKDRLPSCHYVDGPLIVLDGIAVQAASLDAVVPVQFIEAIEVYTAPTKVPVEFSGTRAGCGVIVIWTR